ncbi:MAG: UPF0175 family protein [Desulfobacterales bacterium]|jgi:predicted HTH domain antitoxin
MGYGPITHFTDIEAWKLARKLRIAVYRGSLGYFQKGIDILCEMAGMTVWEFQQLLGARQISVQYDIEDYEEDMSTLKELGRLGR